MKKAFALLFILAISWQGFSTAPQKDGKEKLSPFVGKWDWAWNDKAHRFFVWCGERNDSLLFAIGGTFFYAFIRRRSPALHRCIQGCGAVALLG